MGEENGRRESDTKLALIEQHLEFIAQEMKEENAIGVDGTLYGETGWDTVTATDLWPYPNEAQIYADC